MRLEVDLIYNIAYIKIASGKYAQTVEISDGILLDLTKNGKVLGIEFLKIKEVKSLSSRRY